MKKVDLTGQRFGRLMVLKEGGRSKGGDVKWKCLCECGEETIVVSFSLNSGHTKSCGCLQKDFPNSKTHGMRQTRFYTIWCGMKARCFNENEPCYKNYGGRGVTMCEEWMKFEGFMDDMLEEHDKHVKIYGEKNTTIEREDVNGNYSPSNCSFATLKVQANNRRNNVRLTYNGKTQTIMQWSEEIDIKYDTIWMRYKRKLSIEKVLSNQLFNK